MRLFSFAFRATLESVKVCFTGSTIAGVLLIITRETDAERILPEIVIVLLSTVDSSIGDSKSMRPPVDHPVAVVTLLKSTHVVDVLLFMNALAPLSVIQSDVRVSGLIAITRLLMSSDVRVRRVE